MDCVADPVAEDKQFEKLVKHDAACWGADVVGCGEFWDRLAFGEHSGLDVIAADAADNQHGAGGGWAGGFDRSGERAGSSSEEIVMALQGKNTMLADKTSVHPDIDAEKAHRMLCFSPHIEVLKLAIETLSKRFKSDYRTRFFLLKRKVPSGSTDSSSELLPFVGHLCSVLAEHVSEMKSHFTESSPSDGTISALSATLPSESPLLAGNTILIDFNYAPLLKATIVACLDLLDHERSDSNCPHSDRTDMLIKILDTSWYYAAESLTDYHKSLRPVFDSTFSDIPQLCSLLERTCSCSSPTNIFYLFLIINIGGSLPHMVPRLLEENLVERVIDTSKPIRVPTSNGDFHLFLIKAIRHLIETPNDSSVRYPQVFGNPPEGV
ncbi:hypothetical protein BLNAU_8087 [Blattamonas nauphoetae]|uniref:Uncharacterized protein n=1 Tax=Blattamonas nauphoetae TaxID=2049346 RepID=A0ABQ9XZU9_9EUKA|nr:hypothetical protein BLNAU_8087 [Blattamonas nauphoetae]